MIGPGDDNDNLDPLLREALAWVVRLRSGEATKADVADATEWRGRSPDHEAAFRQAVYLWRDLGTAAGEISAANEAGRSGMRPQHPAFVLTSRRAILAGSLTAAAAAYAVFHPPLGLWPTLSELTADYRTAKGEQQDLVLAQGVTVTLNTQTSISVRETPPEASEFELINGEAAITATRPTGHPVIIHALGTRVVAARAQFTARCLDDVIEVTCITGEVEFETSVRLVQLRANQQIKYSAWDGVRVSDAIDTAQATAWRKGLLIIRNKPLSEVVEEVNRYRSGRIVVTNSELGRQKVNGTFHIDRLEDFIGQVRQLFGAQVISLPGNVVILS